MNQVTNRDKQLEIANLEAKYESDKKDKEIKLKNAELKAKENKINLAKEKAAKEKRTKWMLFLILGMFILG